MMFTTLSEHLKNRAPILVVIGEAGVGKTTLIGTLPKPVCILDYEGGLQPLLSDSSANNYYVADMTKHRASEVIRSAQELSDIKSIAFDGFSNWVRYLISSLVAKKEENGMAVRPATLQDWNKVTQAVNSLLTQLTRLSKPLYIVCGVTEVNGQVYPSVPPSIGRTLRYLADFYGMLVVEPDGKRKLVVSAENFRGKIRTVAPIQPFYKPNLTEIIRLISINGQPQPVVQETSEEVEVSTEEFIDGLEGEGFGDDGEIDPELLAMKNDLEIMSPYQVIKEACKKFQVQLSEVTVQSKKMFGTMKLNDLSKEQAWQLLMWIYQHQG